MANARLWAPPEALYDERSRSALALIITQWAEHWFKVDRPRLTDFRIADKDNGLLGSAGRQWTSLNTLISVAYPSRGAERLIELALDMDAVSEQARLDDTPILQTFHQTLIADLAVRLSTGIRLPDSQEGPLATDALLHIRAGNDEALFSIRLSHAHLVQFRRSLAPSPMRPILAPNIGASLGSTPVSVQVHVGDASLTLSDARNLNVGDVVLLDAPISGGVSLHVANDSAGFARAAIREQDGRMCLEIMETD